MCHEKIDFVLGIVFLFALLNINFGRRHESPHGVEQGREGVKCSGSYKAVRQN